MAEIIRNCPHCNNPIQVNVTPQNKTIRFQDITGFFKYGLNPIVMKGRIENARQEERVGKKGLPTNLIMIAILLMVVGAVAYAIIASVQPEQACCTRLGELAGGATLSPSEAAKYTTTTQAGGGILGGITGLT